MLEGILREADPAPARGVLEIGPGLGFLTGGLLAAGAHVTAVELDRGLASVLRERFAGGGRGRRLPPGRGRRPGPGPRQPRRRPRMTSWPTCRTTSRARSCIGSWAIAPRAERLVLMVQREVAERIAAPPGGMSYLSVFVQYHARARVAFRVPRDAFEPAPKVESAVLVLEPYALDDRLDAEAEDHLWRVVQAGFRERRKMLHNVLARQLPIPGERVTPRSRPAAIDGNRRPADAGGGGVARARRGDRPHPRIAGTAADDGRPDRRAPADARSCGWRRRSSTSRWRCSASARTGIHELHSVMVPLDLADRLSVSVLPPGGEDSLHVDGFDPGPSRTTSSCGPSPPRAATPDPSGDSRSRPRPSPHDSRSGSRSRPGWPAARPTPPPPSTPRWRPGAWSWTPRRAGPRGGAGLGRPVLPGRRPGPGRGPRRAADAPGLAPRDPGSAGRRPAPASCSSRRTSPSRRRRCSGPGTRAPASAAAPLASPPPTLPRSSARGSAPPDLMVRASVLAAANDLAPAANAVEPALVPVQAGPAAAPRPARGPVGLRPHPLGPLSFPCRGGRGRGPGPRGDRRRRAHSARPASAVHRGGPDPRQRPPNRQHRRTPGGNHDPRRHRDGRRPGRHRPVQPGHRHRRPRLLQRPARSRPRHRRPRRGCRGPGAAVDGEPGRRAGRRRPAPWPTS